MAMRSIIFRSFFVCSLYCTTWTVVVAEPAPVPDVALAEPLEYICANQEGGCPMESVGEFLSLLERAAEEDSLLLLHFNWGACSACGNDKPFPVALDKSNTKYGFLRGDIPWRHTKYNGEYYSDHYEPVEAVYKLAWEMLYTKTQRYNGELPVESYAVPPWDRVHFPQVFFIDGASIDKASIEKLMAWNNDPHKSESESAWPPENTDNAPPASDESPLNAASDNDGNPVAPGLFNKHWELVLSEATVETTTEGGATTSVVTTSWEKQRTIHAALGDGLLLQLVNQHLFDRNDDKGFQETAWEETVRLVVEQQKNHPEHPRSCIRYQRGRIAPPAGMPASSLDKVVYSHAVPAADIPSQSLPDGVQRAYFAPKRLFNLKERVFTRVLFDFPSALAITSDVTPRGADDNYYYYQATTFDSNYEWAFSVQPEDSFEGHAIWSRRLGDTEWEKEEGEVTMAIYHDDSP